jgi:hypothetical protein
MEPATAKIHQRFCHQRQAETQQKGKRNWQCKAQNQETDKKEPGQRQGGSAVHGNSSFAGGHFACFFRNVCYNTKRNLLNWVLITT